MATIHGLGVVCRQHGQISVEELSFRPPGPGEVRLAVHACGLCQSDLSAMNGKLPFPLPLVLGHEGSGVIESVGDGVKGWKAGDRAILTLVMPCNCRQHCLGGRPSLCSNKQLPKGRVADHAGKIVTPFMGLGCMADYCVVHTSALIRADDQIPLEKAALISCGVTTGTGAVMNRAKLTAGSSCCVIGCGGVGLSVVQGARISGASQIIAVDTEPSKLAAAISFGATHTVNAKETKNVTKAIRQLTGGGGTDYGFEAVGSPETAQHMINAVKPGGMGCIVGVGYPTDELHLKMNMLTFQEKVVTGSMMGSSIPAVFVPLLSSLYQKGDLLLDEMISKYYDLADAEAAFAELQVGLNLRGVFVMNDLRGLAARSPTSKL